MAAQHQCQHHPRQQHQQQKQQEQQQGSGKERPGQPNSNADEGHNLCTGWSRDCMLCECGSLLPRWPHLVENVVGPLRVIHRHHAAALQQVRADGSTTDHAICIEVNFYVLSKPARASSSEAQEPQTPRANESNARLKMFGSCKVAEGGPSAPSVIMLQPLLHPAATTAPVLNRSACTSNPAAFHIPNTTHNHLAALPAPEWPAQSSPTAVVVPYSLGITECLQQRVTLEHLFFHAPAWPYQRSTRGKTHLIFAGAMR